MPRAQSSYHSNAVVSEQIKNEIQRFESVHPCIYAIYEIIDSIPDAQISQQIRDNVVCIEDSFVNSQEWTLSRSVPDLKLGVVGTLSSGKSALVHRYLTGSYMYEESPEGGRFKKEVVIDGQSYLLLIRDEGSPPDQQFTHWVDAVVFVFSLEDEASFDAVYTHYAKMAHYRSTADIPMILVGTQGLDAISESNPREIDECRARRLSHDLKRCSYYETCATYGLNVERVFRDACQKIIQQRAQQSSRSAPQPRSRDARTPVDGAPAGAFALAQQRSTSVLSSAPFASPRHMSRVCSTSAAVSRPSRDSPFAVPLVPPDPSSAKSSLRSLVAPAPPVVPFCVASTSAACAVTVTHSTPTREPDARPPSLASFSQESEASHEGFDDAHSSTAALTPTPTSTPNAQRKTRRISSLFKPPKDDDRQRNGAATMGVGRAIPIKQGHLFKRSSKSLNKEWKKKYVCLYPDGRLAYHSNLKDYMDDTHVKEILLTLATVKTPGQLRPRPPRSHTQPITVPPPPLPKDNSFSALRIGDTRSASTDGADSAVMLTAYEFIREGCDQPSGASGSEGDAARPSVADTPNGNKKRPRGHRRVGSGAKNCDVDDAEETVFEIVTNDQKRWLFEASSGEERDGWVAAIEQQIELSIGLQPSGGQNDRKHGDRADVAALRRLPGNDRCADCGAPEPAWASYNLGALVCIECSGIHRNLGSHISRVRSLDLDEWPVGFLAVMQALGNKTVNELWEYNLAGQTKPQPTSSRDVKERWVRQKYEQRAFLAPAPSNAPLEQQLVDAVLARDVGALVVVLARCSEAHVNGTLNARDRRTPLHLACAVGNADVTQLLLCHNADVRALDQEGRSALWYARQSGSRHCVAVLTNWGLADDGTLERLRKSSVGGASKSKLPVPLGARPPSDSSFETLPASVI